MLIGYARTSTTDQVAGFDAQVTALQQAGCGKLFKEQVSSVAARQQLEAALDFAREGDTLVVTKLDRLARSVPHMWEIVKRLQTKGVDLRIINLGIDTSTPTGKLMLTMMGGIAEFGREMMLERQRYGIAKAKKEGRYKGRKPTARAKAPDVLRLAGEGQNPSEIAKALGIGRASVYRALAAPRAA